MKSKYMVWMIALVAACGLRISAEEKVVTSLGEAEEIIVTLKAEKDNVTRSNNRTRNNGANPVIYIARSPVARSIFSFDLQGITNEVESAVFRFRQHSTAKSASSFTVAPMVYTANNYAWGEGTGNLGLNGQNAGVGNSCWAASALTVHSWEDADGNPLSGIAEPALWKSSIAQKSNVAWEEGQWIEIEVPVSLIEDARKREKASLTLGMWGTDGAEFYFISSNNSSWAPELVLQLKEEEKKKQE